MAEIRLNDQQQALVDYILHETGSLNLVARAGCGKTFSLIQGAIRTIVEHRLGEVAIMAFNKPIADEFKEKIAALAEATGNPAFTDWRTVQSGTVHSFGFGAWRRVAKGVRVDENKVRDLIADHAIEEPANTYFRSGPAVRKLVSLAKQSGFGVLVDINDVPAWLALGDHHAVDDDAEDDSLEALAMAAIPILKESIALDREVIDFDDMILAPLLHRVRLWPKDWVLIDEAQDTNAARRALALKMLRPRTGRLIAVGDPKQAIMGFTGADSDAMDLIKEVLGSAELPLTVTYRCPKAIVREANKLVPDIIAHESAPEGIIRAVSKEYEVALDVAVGQTEPQTVKHPWFTKENLGADDAVLCRNTKPLIECAYTMLAEGVGCRVLGREIGDGLIRLATRWKRVKTLEALLTKLDEYLARESKKWLAKGREDRLQAVEDKVGALTTIAERLIADRKTDVADLVAFINDLFGEDVTNVVTLCTMHKSKGKEWDRVYLLDRANTLPSRYARQPWQKAQESNLEYVSVTRAKRELIDVVY